MGLFTVFAWLLILVGLEHIHCENQLEKRYRSHPNRAYLVSHKVNALHQGHSIKNPTITNTSAVPMIYVTDYGADPTGSADSTQAFEKAISVALSYGYGGNLSYGIHDCGGATLNLGGGDYLISSPIIIPQYYANIVITSGSIRASASFPKDSYLLIIGDTKCSNVCNQYINVENVMFDGQYQAYGGININSIEGSFIGPAVEIIKFTGAGINISSGHGTVIHNSWIAEFPLDDRYYKTSSATAIALYGPDNTVTDSIIASAYIGVHMADSTNFLNNLHIFGSGYSHNYTGILVGSSRHSRIINCYLDFSHLVIETHVRGLIVSDSYFLGSATIVIKAMDNSSNEVEDLAVLNNLYNKGTGQETFPIVMIDDSMGPITRVKNVIIKDNVVIGDGYIHSSVHASKILSLKNSTEWIFNFEDKFTFKKHIEIQWISYTVEVDDTNGVDFFQHLAQKINDTSVMVKTSQSVDATVYISVDQSENVDYY